MNITIREVSGDLWKKIRIEAIKEGLTIGEAINLALDNWLSQKKYIDKKKVKSFWDIKPVKIDTEDVEYLSEKVDEVLYGMR